MKLLGLIYEVRYKKGAENRVADALSRRDERLQESEKSSAGLLMSVSMIMPMWIQEIMHNYMENPCVQELLTLISVDVHEPSLWHNVNRDTPLGGLSGQLGTFKRLTQYFYWPRMRAMVNEYVAQCESDGQTETVNRCLENYLRFMTTSRPTQWKKWLPAAEWWYNTNFHTDRVVIQSDLSYTNDDGQFLVKPVAILQWQMVKRNNVAVVQVLAQWSNIPKEDATWEDYDFLKAKFPGFDSNP
uniref:Integrase zinc-binding domain-containing protein n=1 Tax=Solanum lycopersicum TaxID=4081 RepID=A0A3Q7IGX6_SOLLC